MQREGEREALCQTIEFRVENGEHGQTSAMGKRKYDLHSICVRLHLDTNSFLFSKWFVDPFFPILKYGFDRRYSKIKWNEIEFGENNFTKNHYAIGDWNGVVEGRWAAAWCTFSMESLEMRTIEFIVHAMVYSTWPLSSCDHRHSFLTITFFPCLAFFLRFLLFYFYFFFFVFKASMDNEQGSKLDSCSIQFTMKKNWIIVLCVCVCERSFVENVS